MKNCLAIGVIYGIIVGFVLASIRASGATTFSEFYVQTTGSNLNAGSSTADAALVTNTNGNWDSTTGVFICSGATDLSAVTVGMFASVYTDGATVGVFVARITAVVDATDTITVSLTAKSGTAPSTSATGRTIKIGGAWKGPNAAEKFPFAFVQNTMTDTTGNVLRVNFKGGTTYSITAGITHANAGPMRFQGYTTTVGDGGKATIDGGTTGASYKLIYLTIGSLDVEDFILQNNGATGAASGFDIGAGPNTVRRCVVTSVRGSGFDASAGTINFWIECEAYACNQNNSAAKAGFSATGTSQTYIRCISHDNTGSNSDGFYITTGATLEHCIADTNGAKGFRVTAITSLLMRGCDAYNNTGDGLDLFSATVFAAVISNSNFVKNGGWGINTSGSAILRTGYIFNCAFGAGTQVNTSGAIATMSGIDVLGTVTYASNVTPWTDPANGDFRINLAAAKGTGIGSFTETAASYAGTVAYPDIGSAQHLESVATGGGSYTFAQ